MADSGTLGRQRKARRIVLIVVAVILLAVSAFFLFKATQNVTVEGVSVTFIRNGVANTLTDDSSDGVYPSGSSLDFRFSRLPLSPGDSIRLNSITVQTSGFSVSNSNPSVPNTVGYSCYDSNACSEYVTLQLPVLSYTGAVQITVDETYSCARGQYDSSLDQCTSGTTTGTTSDTCPSGYFPVMINGQPGCISSTTNNSTTASPYTSTAISCNYDNLNSTFTCTFTVYPESAVGNVTAGVLRGGDAGWITQFTGNCLLLKGSCTGSFPLVCGTGEVQVTATYLGDATHDSSVASPVTYAGC